MKLIVRKDVYDDICDKLKIEKAYTVRSFIPGNGKRKAYWRVRTYEGLQGEQNSYKGRNKDLVEDKNKEKIARNNLLNIMNEDFYNYCKNHTKEDIKAKYSDKNFKPILNVPYRFMKLFPNAKESYVYCGEQTLGVHVNKHNDVSLPVFQDMQKILNNTDNVYQERNVSSPNGIKGVAFEVMDYKGERYAMVVRTDKLGRLIFWKTFHIQHGVKDKWQKINLAKK